MFQELSALTAKTKKHQNLTVREIFVTVVKENSESPKL